MSRLNCVKCTKEMTIDEPGGEAYVIDGLIIQRDSEGLPIHIDDSHKTIRHENC